MGSATQMPCDTQDHGRDQNFRERKGSLKAPCSQGLYKCLYPSCIIKPHYLLYFKEFLCLIKLVSSCLFFMLENIHLDVRLFQLYLLLKFHLRIASSLQIRFGHITDYGFQFVTLEEMNSKDEKNIQWED